MKKRNNYKHINLILYLMKKKFQNLKLKILENNILENLLSNLRKKKFQKKNKKKIDIYIFVVL